jgi:hypothetical protein
MKPTNLTVKLELVTPEIASNWLRFNTGNRNINKHNLAILSNQIKADEFLENGESIVFDRNKELKNGQHRLKAISINTKSFWLVVVRGVEPIAMATFDTGKARTAADVLHLNGFKQSSKIAGLIQRISLYSFKNSKAGHYSGNTSSKMTNHSVLEYTKDNYDWLLEIVRNVESVISKNPYKVISPSSLGVIIYLIGGETPTRECYEFAKHLVGAVKTESSAPLYLHNKLYNSKINKEPLNNYYIIGMAIKCWNYYIEGNPAIRFVRFDINSELPIVKK